MPASLIFNLPERMNWSLRFCAIDLKLQVAFLVQQLLADLVTLGGKIRFVGGRVRNHFEQHLVACQRK